MWVVVKIISTTTHVQVSSLELSSDTCYEFYGGIYAFMIFYLLSAKKSDVCLDGKKPWNKPIHNV